jgi:hypothetical protein
LLGGPQGSYSRLTPTFMSHTPIQGIKPRFRYLQFKSRGVIPLEAGLLRAAGSSGGRSSP